MKKLKLLALTLTVAVILCGCSTSVNKPSEKAMPTTDTAVSNNTKGIIDTETMFTDRDLNYDYSQKTTCKITLKNNASKSDSTDVSINKNIITIKADGVYVLSGKLTNGQIIVDTPETSKVQLVLDSVNINNNTSAAIFCRQANKLFITTIGDSVLSNKEDFKSNDEKINGVICSKSDLTLNGDKKLTVKAVYGNAIVSKDDLAVTSGTYTLTAQNHCLKANNSVRITNANLNLNATKDGIHCDNEDTSKGFVYIESGTIAIKAEDEGIQSSSTVMLCGGEIDIQSSGEGIEGRYIDISGGKLNITAGDDGINATDKSQTQTGQTEFENNGAEPKEFNNSQPAPPDGFQQGTPPEGKQKNTGEMPDGDRMQRDPGQKGGFGGSTDCSITISGGNITVNASGDGLDSNGTIEITGGNSLIYGAENGGDSAFDYQTQAIISGGSIFAVGMSGMAENFSSDSTQGSILYNIDSEGNPNDKIELIKGNETIADATAIKKYNSVLISCPGLEVGNYTIKLGDKTEEIEMTDKQFSNASGNGFGMKGGHQKDFPFNGNPQSN